MIFNAIINKLIQILIFYFSIIYLLWLENRDQSSVLVIKICAHGDGALPSNDYLIRKPSECSGIDQKLKATDHQLQTSLVCKHI